jgi:hypothetical protein
MKRHIEGGRGALSIGTLFVAGFGSFHLLLLILAVVWVASTMIVIPLHFYRVWKKWARVSNRREYTAWVGFETAATVALIWLGIYSAISR